MVRPSIMAKGRYRRIAYFMAARKQRELTYFIIKPLPEIQ
jgi:hypothetical protein